ncbi:MAG TPA: ATP-binding cassette domain-containing protein [Ignavibacteria bacterium]|nr:ATP-binding cassette domain-containing protein [Ignavibacteria bacterium]
MNIDTGWRLGLIGRNGRGKSTLLNLINKGLQPVKGELRSTVPAFYFPYLPVDEKPSVLNVIKENIAPYSYWENRMKELAVSGDSRDMEEFGEILESYQNADGYEIDSMIRKEFNELGMQEELLERDFLSLSGGEQTRALIITLFLKKDSFPMIDEPTDHLDMNGRLLLGEYLSKKNGFILASHDRNFLDICTDHILSINKSDVRLNKGNYSNWKNNMLTEEEYEKRKDINLKRELRSLESAAAKNRKWSGYKEKEKSGAYDKGYIGHRSAKLMKRALHIEERISKKIEEKKKLLNNKEDERRLSIPSRLSGKEKVLSVINATLHIDEKKIFENFSMDIFKGERIALTGNNGSGKTSLIRAIKNEIKLSAGSINIPGFIRISFANQDPVWNKGLLRELLRDENTDETKFRNILGVMGAWGELFDRPLETFSRGQLKKVELCRSFLSESDILIWDEPMNYLDTESREQLEAAILKFRPTMLFTEHDKTFVDKIATGVFSISN